MKFTRLETWRSIKKEQGELFLFGHSLKISNLMTTPGKANTQIGLPSKLWTLPVLHFAEVVRQSKAPTGKDQWRLTSNCVWLHLLWNLNDCGKMSFQAALCPVKFTYKAVVFFPVDELFKEAKVRSNGIINYEEFTQMVTLPPVDYWLFISKVKKTSNNRNIYDGNWLYIHAEITDYI